MVGVELEHALDQVLETIREMTVRLVLAVTLPENISSVHGQTLVISVIWSG